MIPSNRYPWYEIVRDGTLEQGDILRGFEVLSLGPEYNVATQGYDIELDVMDVVVMTQSCDIEQRKIRSLVLCPLTPLQYLMTADAQHGANPWKATKYREAVRQGNIPGYHLISDFEDEEISLPVSVVDFHEIYSAPTAQVLNFIQRSSPRLRLCPPTRST